MFALGLECVDCGAQLPIGPEFFGCRSCRETGRDGALAVVYDEQAAGHSLRAGLSSQMPSMVAFAGLLPLPMGRPVVSLGEGRTPLLPIPASPRYQIAQTYLKNETQNPTWAFKDRFHAVALSMAVELGFKDVVASSTGNHGSSLAAYASAAGLRALIFVEPGAEGAQKHLMELFGATVVTADDRKAPLRDAVERDGMYPSTYITPMPVGNPFGVEGYKTIAYEIVSELGRAPDHFIFPVAAGDGLYGPWRGFNEMARLGVIEAVPCMHGIQASGADPIVRSFQAGLSTVVVHPSPQTIAVSIGDATGGSVALRAIYESNGSAIAVTDDEIRLALRFLARCGIFVEPASAATLAGAWKLGEQGSISSDEIVVCIGTGAGTKWPSMLADLVDDVPAGSKPGK
jgi:threonine synthase